MVLKPKKSEASGNGVTAGGGLVTQSGNYGSADRSRYADRAGVADESKHAKEADYAAEAGHAQRADGLTDYGDTDERYLSKTGDDTAEGKITFKKGAEFGADGAWGYVKQVVEGGTTKVKSWLKNLYTDVFETAVAKVTDYLTGGGGLLTVKGDLTTTKDTENGKLGDVRVGGTLYADAAEIERLLAGEISVDKLTAKVAHFFELSIDEIKSVGGQIILTPANAEIDRVETLSNGDYKCYFKATDGERKISQQFAVGDQVVCATFDAATGTSYNVSNKYYWRLVTAVSSGVVQIDGDDYHYIVMSGTDKDSDSTGIPEAGDKIAQLGSRSSADRQSAIILSAYNGEFLDKGIQAPSMVQYSGINDFTLSSHRQTVISKGLNEFRGTFRATSGKTIEEIVDEQTTEKASDASRTKAGFSTLARISAAGPSRTRRASTSRRPSRPSRRWRSVPTSLRSRRESARCTTTRRTSRARRRVRSSSKALASPPPSETPAASTTRASASRAATGPAP